MDARTLAALKGSIAKWKAIVEGAGIDEGADNCPLCQLFYKDASDSTENDCHGCPVRERTRCRWCLGTPYQQWARLVCDDFAPRADTPERKAAAQAELDFLISLLPEGERI